MKQLLNFGLERLPKVELGRGR